MNQHSKRTTEAGRTKRQFWVVHQEEVLQAEGLSTQEPNAWYIPSIGWTLWLNKSLFNTPREAFAQAFTELDSEKKRLDARIKTLKAQEAHHA